MLYVPIVTPPTSSQAPASPRARELASQIEKLIQDFQRSYPDTKPADIQEAMRIAWGGSEVTTSARRLVAVMLGLGMAALAGALLYFRSGVDVEIPWVMVAVVAGIVLVLAVAVAARRE
jgi:hypothetical protein